MSIKFEFKKIDVSQKIALYEGFHRGDSLQALSSATGLRPESVQRYIYRLYGVWRYGEAPGRRPKEPLREGVL